MVPTSLHNGDVNSGGLAIVVEEVDVELDDENELDVDVVLMELGVGAVLDETRPTAEAPSSPSAMSLLHALSKRMATMAAGAADRVANRITTWAEPPTC